MSARSDTQEEGTGPHGGRSGGRMTRNSQRSASPAEMPHESRSPYAAESREGAHVTDDRAAPARNPTTAMGGAGGGIVSRGIIQSHNAGGADLGQVEAPMGGAVAGGEVAAPVSQTEEEGPVHEHAPDAAALAPLARDDAPRPADTGVSQNVSLMEGSSESMAVSEGGEDPQQLGAAAAGGGVDVAQTQGGHHRPPAAPASGKGDSVEQLRREIAQIDQLVQILHREVQISAERGYAEAAQHDMDMLQATLDRRHAKRAELAALEAARAPVARTRILVDQEDASATESNREAPARTVGGQEPPRPHAAGRTQLRSISGGAQRVPLRTQSSATSDIDEPRLGDARETPMRGAETGGSLVGLRASVTPSVRSEALAAAMRSSRSSLKQSTPMFGDPTAGTARRALRVHTPAPWGATTTSTLPSYAMAARGVAVAMRPPARGGVGGRHGGDHDLGGSGDSRDDEWPIDDRDESEDDGDGEDHGEDDHVPTPGRYTKPVAQRRVAREEEELDTAGLRALQTALMKSLQDAPLPTFKVKTAETDTRFAWTWAQKVKQVADRYGELSTRSRDALMRLKVLDAIDAVDVRQKLQDDGSNWLDIVKKLVAEFGADYPEANAVAALNKKFDVRLRLDIAAREHEHQLTRYKQVTGREIYSDEVALLQFLDRFPHEHSAKILKLRSTLNRTGFTGWRSFLQALSQDALLDFHTVGSDNCIGSAHALGSRSERERATRFDRQRRRNRREGDMRRAAQAVAAATREQDLMTTGVAAVAPAVVNGADQVRSKLSCYWCMKPGHMMRECKARLSGKPAHPQSEAAKRAKNRRSARNAVAAARADEADSRGVSFIIEPINKGRVNVVNGFEITPDMDEDTIRAMANSLEELQRANMTAAAFLQPWMPRTARATLASAVALTPHIKHWQYIENARRDAAGEGRWVKSAIDNGAQKTMITWETVEMFGGVHTVIPKSWYLCGVGEGAVRSDRVVLLPLRFGDTVVKAEAVIIMESEMPIDDTQLLLGLDVLAHLAEYTQRRTAPNPGVHVRAAEASSLYECLLRDDAVRLFRGHADTSPPPWKREEIVSLMRVPPEHVVEVAEAKVSAVRGSVMPARRQGGESGDEHRAATEEHDVHDRKSSSMPSDVSFVWDSDDEDSDSGRDEQKSVESDHNSLEDAELAIPDEVFGGYVTRDHDGRWTAIAMDQKLVDKLSSQIATQLTQCYRNEGGGAACPSLDVNTELERIVRARSTSPVSTAASAEPTSRGAAPKSTQAIVSPSGKPIAATGKKSSTPRDVKGSAVSTSVPRTAVQDGRSSASASGERRTARSQKHEGRFRRKERRRARRRVKRAELRRRDDNTPAQAESTGDFDREAWEATATREESEEVVVTPSEYEELATHAVQMAAVRKVWRDLKSRASSESARLRAMRAEHEAAEVVANERVAHQTQQIFERGRLFVEEGEEAPHIIAPEYTRDALKLKDDWKPWSSGAPRKITGARAESFNKKMKKLLLHKRIRRATPGESKRVSTAAFMVNNGIEADGTPKFRLVWDSRDMNANIVKLKGWHLPDCADKLQQAAGHRFYTVADAEDGFYQLELPEDVVWMTAFRGITDEYPDEYVMLCAPMGSPNIPVVFHKVLADAISEGYVEIRGERHSLTKFVTSFADDIIIWGDTEEEFLAAHVGLARALGAKGVKLNKAKTKFALSRARFLGHLISRDGIVPDPDKVMALLDAPNPENKKELQLFLGMTAYNKTYIDDYSTVAEPLTRMTRKDEPFVWGAEQQRAKDSLVAALVSAPILAPYNPAKRLFVATDASDVGLGAVAKQEGPDGRLHPIAYASKTLDRTQRNYHALEREALAVVWALNEKFKPWVMASPEPTVLITDANGLRFLFAKPRVKTPARQRMERWILQLTHLDFVVLHRPGKANLEPDYLSRLAGITDIDYNVTVTPTAIDERLVGIVQRDSAARQGSVAVGDTRLPNPRVDVPTTTELKEEQQKSPELRGIIDRLRGAKSSLDGKRKPGRVFVQFFPELEYRLANIDERDDKGGWTTVKNVLVVDDVYRPQPEMTAREASRRAGARIVVPERMRQIMLELHHDVPLGGHAGAHRTETAIREHFWWRGLHDDVQAYVEACVDCQRERKPRKPEHAPNLAGAWTSKPREVVAIDFTGPYPEDNQGNRYLCTMIDLFSGWLTVEPCKVDTAAEASRALVERWICTHGAPAALLSDRGSHFVNDTMDKVADWFWIRRLRTSAYTPSTNGALERRHDVIHKALRKFVRGNVKNWGMYIQAVTLAINTTVNRSTGRTPFEIMFGEKARIVFDQVHADTTTDPKEYGRLLSSKLREAWADVRWAHAEASATRNAQWRAQHGVDYQVARLAGGDIVWRRVQDPFKLDSRMAGPYRVQRDVSDGARRAYLIREIATGRHSVANRQDLRLHVGARDFTGDYRQELRAGHVKRCTRCGDEEELVHCVTCTNSICRVCLGAGAPKDGEWACVECRAVNPNDDEQHAIADDVDHDATARSPDPERKESVPTRNEGATTLVGLEVECLWDHVEPDGRVSAAWHRGTVTVRAARGVGRRRGKYGHYYVQYVDKPEPILMSLHKGKENVTWRLVAPEEPELERIAVAVEPQEAAAAAGGGQRRRRPRAPARESPSPPHVRRSGRATKGRAVERLIEVASQRARHGVSQQSRGGRGQRAWADGADTPRLQRGQRQTRDVHGRAPVDRRQEGTPCRRVNKTKTAPDTAWQPVVSRRDRAGPGRGRSQRAWSPQRVAAARRGEASALVQSWRKRRNSAARLVWEERSSRWHEV